jgi:LysR family carnitine catabolism transcriptional activator
MNHMNLTQRQLRIFTLVASTLSVSRASGSMHLSQPALSRAIQEFETQLGVSLFQRTTRSLVLTAQGKKFLPIAQRLLSDINHAVQSVGDKELALGGTVALAVGTAFACTALAPILSDFYKMHPNVRITIRDDNSRGITDRVMRSEVDFGIGTVVGESDSLVLQRLLTAPIGFVFNPSRFALHQHPTVAQLEKLPLLKETDDSSIMNLLRLRGSDVVSMMESGMEVSSLGVQLALAEAGAGVAVMSALGASHPSAEKLRFVRLSPTVQREVFVMHRRDRSLRPPAVALIDAIVAALPKATMHPLVQLDATVTKHLPQSSPKKLGKTVVPTGT